MSKHYSLDFNTEQTKILTNYFSDLRKDTIFIRLNKILFDETILPVEKIFTSVPTNIWMDIKIKSKKIYDYQFTINNTEYQINDNEKGVADKIISKIEKKILQCIDYVYSNPNKRPLILSLPWYSGFKKNFWQLDSTEVISLCHKCILTC